MVDRPTESISALRTAAASEQRGRGRQKKASPPKGWDKTGSSWDCMLESEEEEEKGELVRAAEAHAR